MKRLKHILNNRIWIWTAALLFVLAALPGAGELFLSSLALEQQVRCNIMEHVHTEECYVGEVLICREKAHTHSKNCYLLLLEDNDINMLLGKIDAVEGKSLEKILSGVVDKAILYDGGSNGRTGGGTGTSSSAAASTAAELWAQYSAVYGSSAASAGGWTFFTTSSSSSAGYLGTGSSMEMLVYAASMNGDVVEADISQLNENIENGNIQPKVTLNESLTTLALTPEDIAPIVVENHAAAAPLAAGSGASTHAVGATPDTSKNHANFYIYVVEQNGNGSWVCIGTTDVDVTTSSNNYYKRYTSTTATKSVVGLFQTALESTTIVTENNINSLNLQYHTYGTDYIGSYGGSPNSITSSTITFEKQTWQSNTASSAKYVWWPDQTFYIVSYDYLDNSKDFSFYVPAETSLTVESLSAGYVWSGSDGNTYDPNGTTKTIKVNSSVTLTEKANNFTVTYVDKTNASTVYGPFAPSQAHTVIVPPTGYRWSDASGKIYMGGESINTTTTLTANICRVTIDGKEQWVKAGDTITLPEGYTWSDGSNTYDGGAGVTIYGDTSFEGTPITFDVTIVDGTGKSTTTTHLYGADVKLPALPEGYVWKGSDGKSYTGGSTYGDLQSDMTFTAEEKTLNVRYTVDFPTNVSWGSYALGSYTKPTLAGTERDQLTETASGGASYGIRNVSSQKVTAVTTNHKGFGIAVMFLGWQTESGELLSPGTHLTWEVLEAYDQNGDGTVALTGRWDYGTSHVANFCIRYNSAIQDANGNISTSSNLYTNAIFTTYVGGSENKNEPLPNAENQSDAKAKEADDTLRSWVGERSSGYWFYDFPKDSDVFESLKSYANLLSVTTNGVTETVKSSELNATNYTIRWYVMKYDGVDGWHIDGRLVKKQGRIIVDKSFAGDADAVAAAKNGFYILAENGTKDETGNFEPYLPTDKNYKCHTLTLDNATTGDAADNYEWLIANVTLGEYWRITEYPTGVDGASYYAEYSVYDTDGNTTAVAEYGTRAAVVGKTFALDEDPDQGLLVDFRNYYYPTGSILIKKEDAKTGKPIGNAVFELYQKGKQLTFDYNSETGQYVRNEAGTGAISQITTAADGFSIISTTGFSYEYGDVVVKEVTAPPGYDPAPNITLGWNSETEKNVVLKDLSYPNGDAVDSGKWADHAEVPNNDVLVVKDGTSYYADVTVTKEWDPVDMAQESVVVALQVNGTRATSIFPGLANVEVILSAENQWTYTWTDLPAYANGELAEWGVKEIKVGGDPTLADGETFANWIAVTALRQKTDSDANGIVDTWDYLVTNTPRRTMIVLNKVDHLGNALAGAAFTLVEAAYSGVAWQPISGAVALSAVTDANGILKFDALTAGKTYLLTEVQAPEGYVMTLPPHGFAGGRRRRDQAGQCRWIRR